MTMDQWRSAEAYRRQRYFRKLGRDVVSAGLTLSVLVLLGLWVAG